MNEIMVLFQCQRKDIIIGLLLEVNSGFKFSWAAVKYNHGFIAQSETNHGFIVQ